MRRTCAALSPKLQINRHPKNAVRFKPGTAGFYKPHYGASKMKWQFTLPYERKADSLHHYPEISRITGRPIDWYHQEPDDGYGGLRMFGENTLELKGMPLGRTPEYMQERLRRFFSKFGPVKHCRAEPHALDPYQCEGTAWVTFRDRPAAMKALRAPLKFPASLHDKVISMRSLDTDKKNDPDYFEKSKFWNAQLIDVARQLHIQLSTEAGFAREGKPMKSVGHGISERELVALPHEVSTVGRGGIPQSKGLHGAPTRMVSAGPAVLRRFGSWEAFLTELPFDELFAVARKPSENADSVHLAESPDAPEEANGHDSDLVVLPRVVSTRMRARILHKAGRMLKERLHQEFSVWWREGRIALPEYTQRRVEWWDHMPKLPWELQIMSRSKDRVKIFDEKWMYRQQLRRARNTKRKEARGEHAVERKKIQDEKTMATQRRKESSAKAIDQSRCSGLVGQSPGLVKRCPPRF